MRLGERPWREALEAYPVERYPDYAPGKPPQLDELHRRTYLDEVEAIWGRCWGCQGIGRLREVALVRCDPDYEGHGYWARHPDFFLLRHNPRPDLDLFVRHQQAYADTLVACGVNVRWLEIDDALGAYGPMRKFFIGGALRIFRGGAILPRAGEGAAYRGIEREFQKLLTGLGCPVIGAVIGAGIYEAGSVVPVGEGVLLAGLSCALNEDGLAQILPVLRRCGVTEVHVSHMQTIMDSFASGGEFHIDMVVGTLGVRKAIVYPGALDYQTYRWLKDKGFQLAEIPADEQRRYAPANLVVLGPNRVVMARGAVKTIRAVEAMGVEVVPIETEGIMQGGVNGISCITMQLLREPGPGLAD
jgi:N-dimethylarginine dimethylaminohydrolase